MAKYKNLEELAKAFNAGELKGWVLMLDNDSTHLDWHGGHPKGKELTEDEAEEFEYKKYEEGQELYNGHNDIYILDQALTLAGIPNMGV